MSSNLKRKTTLHLEEFRKTIQDNALEVARRENASHYALKESSEKIFPRLFQYEADDYYRRGDESGGGKVIKCSEILDTGDVITRKDRENTEFFHVTVVGPAGSGKTTLLRFIAKDVITHGQEEDMLVHIVECCNFYPDNKISISDFLFTNMTKKPSSHSADAGYKWMLQNSDKVLLVIDSLDNLSYDLDNAFNAIKPDELSNPATILNPTTILSNLLVGKILPKARIISSSREYKILDFVCPLRADRIITLRGFSTESISKVVFILLKKNEAERIWRILTTECEDLLDLCETPLFLYFVLAALQDHLIQEGNGRSTGDEDDQIPNTVTGILVKVFNCVFRSVHARRLTHPENSAENAINKMKRLAKYGIEQQKFSFTDEEVEEKFKLTKEEIGDIGLSAPERAESSWFLQLFETGGVSLFTHQCLQEFLAACSYSEMALHENRDFLRHIHDPKYFVIKRMMCGLLLNQQTFDDASEDLLQGNPEINEVRNELRGVMGKLLDSGKVFKMELFLAIREAGNEAHEIVPKNLKEIDLSWYQTLVGSDLVAIACCIFHCETLRALKLTRCGITSKSIERFSQKLEGSKVQIEVLNVGGSDELGRNGIKAVGRLVQRHMVQELGLNWCKAVAESIEVLDSSLGDATMKILDLSTNDNLGRVSLMPLGRLVWVHAIRCLFLMRCGLVADSIRTLADGLGNTKLELLDISGNRGIGVDGVTLLAMTLAKCNLEILGISDCNLGLKEGKCFRDRLGLGYYKLSKLMMFHEVTRESRHYTFGENQQVYAAIEMLPVVSECLDFSGYHLTSEDQLLLKSELDKLYPKEPTIVYGGDCDQSTGEWKRRIEIKASKRASLQTEIDLQTKGNREEKHYPDPQTFETPLPGEKTASIDATGGHVNVNGCAIQFSPNAISGKCAQVRASTSLAECDIRDCMSVSPVLLYKVSSQLSKPAKIKIPIWAETDDFDISFRIFGKYHEYGEWKERGSATSNQIQNRMVEFESKEPSLLRVVVDSGWANSNRLKYFMTGSLFYYDYGKFTFGFHIDDQTARQNCFADLELKDTGAKPCSLLCQPFQVSNGSRLNLSLDMQEALFPFDAKKRTIEISTEFLHGNEFKYKDFSLPPDPKLQSQLQSTSNFNYRLMEGNQEKGVGAVCVSWMQWEGNHPQTKYVAKKTHSDGQGNEASTTEETIATIDSTGGDVNVNTCIVQFPPNAFSEKSADIRASTFLAKCDVPNHQPVSPILRCKIPVKLNQPIKIKIPIWASSDDPNIRFRIYCKKDDREDGEWAEIGPATPTDGVVEFKYEEFSEVFFRILGYFIQAMLEVVQCYAKGSLYYDKIGNFTFGIHVDDETARKECFTQLENLGAELTFLRCPRFRVHSGGKVKVSLRCLEETYNLGREEAVLEIDRDFLRGRTFKYFNTFLRPRPDKAYLDYRILFQEEEVTKGEFCVAWPEEAERRQPRIFHIEHVNNIYASN